MTTATEKAIIERAGRALIDAVPPFSKVYLVPSSSPELQFLVVVEQDLPERHGEMVRLNKVLGELLIPADVVVVSEAELKGGVPQSGSFVKDAIRSGIVIAES